MFKSVIKQYINSISVNDVIMFAKSEFINVSVNEASLVLNYLKNNWENLIHDDINVKVFLENNFDFEKQKQIYNLYLKYKKRYKNYL